MNLRRLVGFVIPAASMMIAAAADAEKRPQPGPVDPRIQSVVYDMEDVVLIEAAPGHQVTIQFAPDERIENVAVGDSAAWQATSNKRGDHLFIKPLRQDARTDMTVVTDARIYAFTLSAIYQPSESTPITVRFRYLSSAPVPAIADDAASAAPSTPASWRYRGERKLRPQTITDDGVHIEIVWPAGAPIPAVFAVDAERRETLVNGMMREGRFVVDTVVPELIFRIDRHVGRAVRTRTRRPR